MSLALTPLTQFAGFCAPQGGQNEKVKLVQALAKKGAVEDVIKILLNDEDPQARKAAAFALGDLGGEKAVDALIKALENDKDPGVRHVAAFSLGRIGNNKAVDALLKALKNDNNPSVKLRAIYALGEIGDKKAFGPILQVLKECQAYESSINGINKHYNIDPRKIKDLPGATHHLTNAATQALILIQAKQNKPEKE